jgi:hypothetical protein
MCGRNETGREEAAANSGCILRGVSDCLAPPYSVTEDMNGAKAPVKTCYKCKTDGHVRFFLSPAWRDSLPFLFMQSRRLPGIVPRDASPSRRRTMRGERSKKVPGPAVAGHFPQTEVRACIERENQSILCLS